MNTWPPLPVTSLYRITIAGLLLKQHCRCVLHTSVTETSGAEPHSNSTTQTYSSTQRLLGHIGALSWDPRVKSLAAAAVIGSHLNQLSQSAQCINTRRSKRLPDKKTQQHAWNQRSK